MNCPPCAAPTTRKRLKKTKLGYTTFFCPNSLYWLLGTSVRKKLQGERQRLL